MITATRTENRITVTGHAGAGAYGHDIVCAGVSTLVQVIGISLEGLARVEISPGKAVFEWEDGYSPQREALIDALWLGLVMIADKYPEHVKATTSGDVVF